MEKNEQRAAAAAGANMPGAAGANKNEKVLVLPFTGEVVLGDSNGSEFIGVYMNNPFEGEPFDKTRLTFEKPDKKDKWGNPTSDRAGEERGGLFEWLAKKALKTAGSKFQADGMLKFNGEITYRRWSSKKGDIDYINISIISPLGEIKGSRTLNAYLRSGKDEGVFEYLAKERLHLVREQYIANTQTVELVRVTS